MSKSKQFKRYLDYALTVLLFGFAAFLIIGVFIYTRPVNVIDIPKLETEKKEYVIGEDITLISEGQTFRIAQSTYDRRFVCRDGLETRELIDVLAVNTTPRPMATVTNVVSGSKNITGKKCVVQIVANAEVEILPFVTKNVLEIFESNEFVIKE